VDLDIASISFTEEKALDDGGLELPSTADESSVGSDDPLRHVGGSMFFLGNAEGSGDVVGAARLPDHLALGALRRDRVGLVRLDVASLDDDRVAIEPQPERIACRVGGSAAGDGGGRAPTRSQLTG
jgi:hypothetical protein